MNPIESRLERLEDIQAIQQLFIEYGHYLDAGDFEAYGRLFAEEGQIQLGPLGRARGPEAITRLMRNNLEQQVGNSYHLITSPIIALNGDQASSEVMWTVIVRSDLGQPRLTMMGRHKDKLIKRSGQWLFLLRQGFIDLPEKMSRD